MFDDLYVWMTKRISNLFRLYIDDLYHSVPVGIYEGMFFVFCIGVFLFLTIRGFKTGAKLSLCLLVVEYVFLLYSSTVFFRPYTIETGHELTPFWSYMAIQEGKSDLKPVVLMNIAVFVPLGFLLYMFKELKWWMVLLIGFVVSLSIEMLQYIFHRGCPEFDDIFHNTLGCLVGIAIYKAVSSSCKFLSAMTLRIGKVRI